MHSNDGSDFLDRLNTEFERSFSLAARVSHEMQCPEESHLAAKRVFSYNPNSKQILELFPEYAPIIDQISQLVDRSSQTLRLESNNPELWTLLGYCYLTLGDFPNAFAAFAHSLRVSSDSVDPVFWYAMGIVYAHYKFSDHAISCFTKTLQFDPNFPFAPDVKLRIAIVERSVHNFEASVHQFQSILSNPPNGLKREDVQFQIAYTLQLQGLTDSALDIYRELHDRFPKCEMLTEQFCWFLYLQHKEGNLSIAKRTVDEAINSNPLDPTLLLIAARIAMKQDDIATAYHYYKFCIQYCLDSPFFWCGLGVLYYKNEQTQDAVVAFQRALYLKSEMPEAWLNIGLIFEEQSDYQNAIKIYQTGSQRCSDNPEFHIRLQAINSQRSGHRKLAAGYSLIDIDDAKFITPPPEQFAVDYMSAVPELPAACYRVGEIGNRFAELSTFPRSIFP
jgi:tetratricopeptide (TPR) repeat protein